MADTLIQGTTIIEDKRREFGRVWSCSGTNFSAVSPDTMDVSYEIDGHIDADAAGGISVFCPVFLPQGVELKTVVVYGDNAALNYTFRRVAIASGTADTIGTTTVNTEDSTLSNVNVDNYSFAYFIYVTDLGDTNSIYGARITYD